MSSPVAPAFSLFVARSALSLGCVPEGMKALSAQHQAIEIDEITNIPKVVEANYDGIFVIYVTTREEFAALAEVLVATRNEMKRKRFVLYVFCADLTSRQEQILIKAGCQELLPPTLSAKALIHKLKRSFLSIEKRASVDSAANAELEAGTQVRQRYSGQCIPSTHEISLEVTEALTDPADFWLIGIRPYAKKIFQQWFVELIGPSPAVGKWIRKTTDSPTDAEENGEWVWHKRVDGEIQTPVDTEGQWIFSGRRPFFSWVVNRWGFISTNPTLFYREKENVRAVRFNLRSEWALQIHGNSANAIAGFAAMKATFRMKPIDVELEFPPTIKLPNGSAIELPWSDSIDSTTLHPDKVMVALPEPGVKTGIAAMEKSQVNVSVNGSRAWFVADDDAPGFLTLVVENLELKTDALVNVFVDCPGYNALPASFSLLAFVSDCTRDQIADQHQFRVTVVLDELAHQQLQSLKMALFIRQEEIESFLKEAKGVG